MAARKKVSEQKQPEYYNKTCGECGNGRFFYDIGNLDLNGKPICLDCPYTENRKRIRSERACDKWKPKSINSK